MRKVYQENSMWRHEGTEEMGVKVVCVSTKNG